MTPIWYDRRVCPRELRLWEIPVKESFFGAGRLESIQCLVGGVSVTVRVGWTPTTRATGESRSKPTARIEYLDWKGLVWRESWRIIFDSPEEASWM